MLRKLIASMILALLSLTLPLATKAQDSERTNYVADYSQTDRLSITMHRDGDCNSPPLDPTKDMSFVTGDTFAICFEPSFLAYIYIVNESVEGTYIAYPESASQLGAVNTRQSYAFELVGKPGQETLIFFVSKEPIAHLEDLIRRGQLQLSHSQLYSGDGAENSEKDTEDRETKGTYNNGTHARGGTTVQLKDSLRQSLGLFRPIAFEWLEAFFERLQVKSTISLSKPFTLERVRYDAELTNTLNARPLPDSNNVARLLNRKAMVLKIVYQHRSPR